MSYTKLAEVEELVAAAGLDVDALSLIITEALDEDLGGRGVLPPGVGSRLDVTSYATIPADAVASGAFVVRQSGTVAGLPVAAYTVASVCAAAGDFELTIHSTDG
jgi:nicotinate-nucleotide pyrophosphorylase (carboxylating)